MPAPPSIDEQRAAIAAHWTDTVEFYGERHACRVMRKFGIKYAEHHPNTAQVRDAFIAVQCAEDFLRALDTWYNPAVEWPPVLRREGHGHLVAAGAVP